MVGCLFPFVLLIVGGATGVVFGGHLGAYYGGTIGLLAGVVVMIAFLWVLSLAKQR